MHFKIRLEKGRQCTLVLIGATAEDNSAIFAAGDFTGR